MLLCIWITDKGNMEMKSLFSALKCDKWATWGYGWNVTLIKTTLSVDSTLDEMRFQSDAIPLNGSWRRKELWVCDYRVKLFSDTRQFQSNVLRLFRKGRELDFFFFSPWLILETLPSLIKIKAITPFWKKSATKAENAYMLVSVGDDVLSSSSKAEMIIFQCSF